MELGAAWCVFVCVCVGGGVAVGGGGQIGVGVSGATYTNVKCGYAVCVFEPES